MLNHTSPIFLDSRHPNPLFERTSIVPQLWLSLIWGLAMDLKVNAACTFVICFQYPWYLPTWPRRYPTSYPTRFVWTAQEAVLPCTNSSTSSGGHGKCHVIFVEGGASVSLSSQTRTYKLHWEITSRRLKNKSCSTFNRSRKSIYS